MLEIRWKDGRGRTRQTTALLEDIAIHGACLQLDRALPLDTMVTLEHARGEMCGVVRYCIYQEIGYFIGIQFTPDSEWSRSKFTPQHLLDLEELVMRRVKESTHRGEGRGRG
jgi:hypothetical protein